MEANDIFVGTVDKDRLRMRGREGEREGEWERGRISSLVHFFLTPKSQKGREKREGGREGERGGGVSVGHNLSVTQFSNNKTLFVIFLPILFFPVPRPGPETKKSGLKNRSVPVWVCGNIQLLFNIFILRMFKHSF